MKELPNDAETDQNTAAPHAQESNMYADIPYYEGHIYTEGKGYDTSGPIPIIGWYDSDGTGELMMPILPRTTPEYQARLDAIHNKANRSAYSKAMDNFSAEDLDRKCTEAHEYNTAYRERHGL